MRPMLYSAALTWALACSANAQQSEPPDVRVAAVRDAAVEIARIQRQDGNGKAMSLVNECHRHVLRTKSAYDAEVEVCLVRDYYVTLSSAGFFSLMSEEFRRKNSIDTDRMKTEMRERIGATLGYFKVQRPEAEYLAKLLRENVMQAALEARVAK